MNKLLYLINVDLRRSNKFYIAYISFFSLITLSLNLFEINKFKNSKFIMNLAIEDFGSIIFCIYITNSLHFPNMYNWNINLVYYVQMVLYYIK